MTEQEMTATLHAIRVDNFKVLRTFGVEFTTGDRWVEISGPNEQGKTTFIDLVWHACGGKRPASPVHDGEETAEIEVDLRIVGGGDEFPDEKLNILRTWDAYGGSKLKVTGDKRGKLRSPQAVLDGLLNAIAFDPFAWIDLAKLGKDGRRRQAKQLIDALGLELPPALQVLAETYEAHWGIAAAETTIDAFESVDVMLRDRRRDKNKDAVRVAAEISRMVEEGAEEVEHVDVDELKELAGEAREAGTAHKLAAQRAHDTQRAIEEADAALHTLTIRLEEEQAQVGDALEELEGLGDLEKLEEQISAAEATNKTALRWDDVRGKRVLLEEVAEEVELLDEGITGVAEIREKLLADSALPTDLSFDSVGGLLYKGQPFPEQASGEEQITVAMEVVTASRPTLRLLRIRDGNRLDSKHRKALKKLLADRDFTALVEIVDETGEIGIVLEDGAVVADNR